MEAWCDAFLATLEELHRGGVRGCVLSVDDAIAVLFAGLLDNGEVDLPATRALAERMLAGITGEPALEASAG